MYPEEQAEICRAGDILVEMVGNLMVRLERGETLSAERAAVAREGILAWHRMRHITSGV